MTTVSIRKARTNLSKLIEQACRGEEVVIAHGAEPVVRLVPVADVKVVVNRAHCGFFEPLADEELARW